MKPISYYKTSEIKETTWGAPEGMDEYLKPTELCDSDNEEIKNKARELVKDAATQKEAALSIFYFVRDGVRYALDFNDVKASHTLKTGLGICTHKPTLQIALLRATGIAARYHQVGVRKELIQGILSGLVYGAFPEVIDTHAWCECYLSGKWISCEAVFDKALFEGMAQRRFATASQMSSIDWDGENDLILVKPWVVEDLGVFDSLDALWIEIAKQQFGPRILQRIAISFSNRCTNRLRKR